MVVLEIDKEEKLMRKSTASNELTAVEDSSVDPLKPAGDIPNNLEADDDPPRGFTEILYNALDNALGVKNPYQMFSMLWPATPLDAEALNWDPNATGYVMPPDVYARVSLLLDTYVPPAPITQPDGTTVSERYMRAISQFGPITNKELLRLQRLVREKLNKPITVLENGEEVTTTLIDQFARLNSMYIDAKRQWEQENERERQRLGLLYPGEPQKQNQEYMKWYATNAPSQLAKISAAYERLLSEFPLHEWEAAISILDTTSNFQLTKAKHLIQNLTVEIPTSAGGGSYVPTSAVPENWSRDLKTNPNRLDLLETPAAKLIQLNNEIRALESELLAWRAIMPQVDDKTVKENLDKFQSTLGQYEADRTALLQDYSKSVYVAATAVVAYQTSFSSTSEKFVHAAANTSDGQSFLENLCWALDASYGLGGGEAQFKRVEELAKALTDQQNSIWEKQNKMLTAGENVAAAAEVWLKSVGENSDLKWIQGYIDNLQTKINAVRVAHQEYVECSLTMLRRFWISDAKPEVNYTPKQTGGKGAFVPATLNALDEKNHKKAVARENFAEVDNPNVFDAPDPDDWTEIIMEIRKKDMESSQQVATSYSRRQWGVNFFFGSYGANSEQSTSDFASEYMDENSKINLGMLCKKIQIRRNWMLPSVFVNTEDYFRSGKTPVTKKTEVLSSEIEKNEELQAELMRTILPAYSVGFLLAKNVSIKMNFSLSESERIKKYARSVESSGGGFFMFGHSSVNSSTKSSESVTVSVDAGEIQIKFNSPQVIGYYLQLTPPDASSELNEEMADEILSGFSFLNQLKAIHAEASLEPVSIPSGDNK
jgi:hypothetical protein